jgi:hypothetical protein
MAQERFSLTLRGLQALLDQAIACGDLVAGADAWPINFR